MVSIRITNNIEHMIKKNKEEKGIELKYIAKKANISQQSLSNLCKSYNPTIESIAKIAYALDCSIGELIKVEIIDENKTKNK